VQELQLAIVQGLPFPFFQAPAPRLHQHINTT